MKHGQPYADGPLTAPTLDSAAYDSATGMASLLWTSGDTYDRVTALYRVVGSPSWRPSSTAIASTALSADIPLTAGSRYEVLLRAYGVGRTADSAPLQVSTT